MRIKINVTTEDGEVLTVIAGSTNDESDCPDDCLHDSHFSIDYVQEGRGIARDQLALDILRLLPS